MKKLLILILILISGCSTLANQVCINSQCFEVEIADNPIERTQGLMYRTSLPENQGMLFIFDTPNKYGFWMRNTKIPLDIIWINESLEIVDISKNTQPCTTQNCKSYVPNKKALYVLELNANQTEKYNINIGNKIKIN